MIRAYVFIAFLITTGFAPAVEAFHTLDCGPFRTTLTDKKTGTRTCLEQVPGVREQYMRTQKLQKDQERRTRDLLLEQRQMVKAQDLIDKRERNKQQQFVRLHSRDQRKPALSLERTLNLQEGQTRQDQEDKLRREKVLESTLSRQQNLLEQKLVLPRSDLLDDQKALIRRRLKDQTGQ
ncbi:MAG: hypothetical protein ISR51_06235 [Rhodospirillales bacterium]|nr:hypothetical protein [Alphaproteobacteria bacterium]MBL6948258.1 hypothetical protein [Rhodospirillales bacterium]